MTKATKNDPTARYSWKWTITTLDSLRQPLRIKDFDKTWTAGAEPTLTPKGNLSEFHIKGYCEIFEE